MLITELIVGYALDEGTMFVDEKFDFTTAKTRDEILDYCIKFAELFNYPKAC